MPVLKDVSCSKCGATREAVLDGECTRAYLRCDPCGTTTPHVDRCTGGCKLKPYICSFDGRDWSGDVKHMGVSSEYADGRPVTEADGSPTGAHLTNSNTDRIEAKREIKNWKRKRADGSHSLTYSG